MGPCFLTSIDDVAEPICLQNSANSEIFFRVVGELPCAVFRRNCAIIPRNRQIPAPSINFATICTVYCGSGEARHDSIQMGKPRVLSVPLRVAIIDLLHDHRQFEQAEAIVK